jgi:hypothetical protein
MVNVRMPLTHKVYTYEDKSNACSRSGCEKLNEETSLGIPTGKYEDNRPSYQNGVRIRGS